LETVGYVAHDHIPALRYCLYATIPDPASKKIDTALPTALENVNENMLQSICRVWEVKAMYRTKSLPRLVEKEVLHQTVDLLEFANVRTGATPRMLTDWAQRGLIEPPQSPGGRGNLRTFEPEVTGEIVALTHLQDQASFSTKELRDIRTLALQLENLYPSKETAQQIAGELRRAWKGKNLLAPAVVSWLSTKHRTLNFIYHKEFESRKKQLADILVRAKRRGETPDHMSDETRAAREEINQIAADERRDDYFDTDEFLKFVVLLSHEASRDSKKSRVKSKSQDFALSGGPREDPLAILGRAIAGKAAG
jgi:DNA-binding transcriptional MerR regulator